ncbi:hypothetical protein TNCV_833611 [Trichonephila clavipes]|nr:hypothetical protein TNCV_833611 [Trichonephila clavipes]
MTFPWPMRAAGRKTAWPMRWQLSALLRSRGGTVAPSARDVPMSIRAMELSDWMGVMEMAKFALNVE